MGAPHERDLVALRRDNGERSWADPYEAAAHKESAAAASFATPRVVSAGPLLTGGRVSYGVSQPMEGPTSVADEVQRHQLLGLDFIKSYVRADYGVQRRGIIKAHQRGLRATSHELYPAVAYGVDAVEHLLGTSRRGFSWKATAEMRAYDDVIQIIRAKRRFRDADDRNV